MIKGAVPICCVACTLVPWMGSITVAHALQGHGVNQDRSCVISGKVTHRGSPIKGATIHIKPAPTPEELVISAEARRLGSVSVGNPMLPPVKSDQNGEFCISDIAPGNYTVSAKKSGYMESAFGATTSFESGSIVVIKKDGPYPKIEIDLFAQAVVTGQVVDPDGDPVDEGSVIVLSVVALRGSYRTIGIRNVPLNELGEFRASQLPPGRYYLRFQPPPRPPQQLSGGSDTGPRQMPRLISTFYPSAVTITQAVPVILQAGESMANIVITAQLQNTYSIRGRLLGLDGYGMGAVMSISPSDQEQTIIVASGGHLKEDNTFVFDDISSGQYTITYLDSGPTFVQIPISVANSDIDDLIVRPPSRVQLKGRISLDSMDGDVGEVKVALRQGKDRVVGPVYIGKVSNSGRVTFDTPIPADVYRVVVNTPEGYYIKSIFYGSTDVTHGLIDLSDLAGDLAIVIGAGTGEVEVRVRVSEREQSGGILHYVVLQSEADEGAGKVYMSVTLEDTRAVLKNIPPGRYRAYAFRSLDATSVTVPETLKHLKEFGTPIEVSANTLARAAVSVVPALRAAEAFEGSTKYR